MIDIQLTKYDSNYYKYKLISHLDIDDVHFLNVDELMELEMNLKDALWLVRGYLNKDQE